MRSAKAVFLDRDGTLNPDPGYINEPNKFEFYDGTISSENQIWLSSATNSRVDVKDAVLIADTYRFTDAFNGNQVINVIDCDIQRQAGTDALFSNTTGPNLVLM